MNNEAIERGIEECDRLSRHKSLCIERGELRVLAECIKIVLEAMKEPEETLFPPQKGIIRPTLPPINPIRPSQRGSTDPIRKVYDEWKDNEDKRDGRFMDSHLAEYKNEALDAMWNAIKEHCEGS